MKLISQTNNCQQLYKEAQIGKCSLEDRYLTRPNLFHFATSEHSQDAFISWLLSWAETRGSLGRLVRILDSESKKASFPLLRPSRRRNGTWMTVAIFNEDYLQIDQNGIIDLDKTVEFLQTAERFLDHAVNMETA